MLQSFGVAHLGKDMEIRYLPDGKPVGNLALAFEYGPKAGGKRATQWIEGTLWGTRAEKLREYMVKGQGVAVILDNVHMQTYNTADGTPRSKLVGEVTSIEFAGSPPQQQAKAPPPQAPAPRPAAPRQASVPGSGFDDMDDDIPF